MCCAALSLLQSRDRQCETEWQSRQRGGRSGRRACNGAAVTIFPSNHTGQMPHRCCKQAATSQHATPSSGPRRRPASGTQEHQFDVVREPCLQQNRRPLPQQHANMICVLRLSTSAATSFGRVSYPLLRLKLSDYMSQKPGDCQKRFLSQPGRPSGAGCRARQSIACWAPAAQFWPASLLQLLQVPLQTKNNE
jgi:hypothetical protein